MPNSMRPGDVLAGRYRMIDLLNEARGGLFFRAWDSVLARHVAIHIIKKDDERADTLMQAARTSALLLDPRLLRVLDAGTTGDLCYVVNEWGEGLSLDHLLDEEPLNPRRGAWIVAEVAELIAAAHAKGILHARLVPEAVMIDESGAVKVIGFAVDSALHGNPTLTPEAEVTDVAALLYAVLTGRWPGREGSRLPAAPQEHGRTLRPRQVRAGVPRVLDTLCDEVLSPYPSTHDHGYDSATAIAFALTDYIGDPAAMAAAEAARSRGNTSPRIPRIEPDLILAPGDPEPEPEPQPEPDAPGEETVVGVPVFDETDTPPDTELHDRIDDDLLTDPSWRTPDPEPAPPPPPFEEAPERPLFAPDPPEGRVTRPTYDAPPSSTDSYWPWSTDTHAPPPSLDEEEEPDDAVPGRNWMRTAWTIAAVVLIAMAMIYAFNRGRSDNSSDPDPEESRSPQDRISVIQPAGVSDLDPQGTDGGENPELTGLTIDGDPATAWRTSSYTQNFGPDGLKTGVGLVVSLESTQSVAVTEVTTVGDPTEISLYAGTGEPPGDVADLEPVATGTTEGEQVELRPEEPVDADWLVVWLTSLPTGDDGYRGQVAEIVVRG